VEGNQVSKFRTDTETVPDMQASLGDGRHRDQPEIKLKLSGNLMTRRERISICSHIYSGEAWSHDPFCQGSIVLLGFAFEGVKRPAADRKLIASADR
jgi:hypothetical protein